MKPPSAESLREVAIYWQWVRDMSCKHELITFTSEGFARCGSDCGRPIRVLSDVQIDNLKGDE